MRGAWRRWTARLRRRPDRSAAALGRRGERHAASWLRRRGYRILERNLSIGRDEADLVALTPDERAVVLVEVKTRRKGRPWPEEAVGPDKRRQMARLAARLRRRGPYRDRPVRLDVIAIVWPEGRRPEVRHYENVG